MSTINYSEKIPNNVNLAEDRERLQQMVQPVMTSALPRLAD